MKFQGKTSVWYAETKVKLLSENLTLTTSSKTSYLTLINLDFILHLTIILSSECNLYIIIQSSLSSQKLTETGMERCPLLSPSLKILHTYSILKMFQYCCRKLGKTNMISST